MTQILHWKFSNFETVLKIFSRALNSSAFNSPQYGCDMTPYNDFGFITSKLKKKNHKKNIYLQIYSNTAYKFLFIYNLGVINVRRVTAICDAQRL